MDETSIAQWLHTSIQDRQKIEITFEPPIATRQIVNRAKLFLPEQQFFVYSACTEKYAKVGVIRINQSS